MERAAIIEQGPVMHGREIQLGSPAEQPHAAPLQPDEPNIGEEPIVPLEDLELAMVQRAMRVAGGNQSQAARLLHVSRDQLRYRVKRYREMGRWPEELEFDDFSGADA
jgi:DNA-binding NtrC family response regulator